MADHDFDLDDMNSAVTFHGNLAMTVLDADLDPNTVLDETLPFTANFTITLAGNVPVLMTGRWVLDLYGESYGPGPEVELGTKVVAADGSLAYTDSITVPAGTLPSHSDDPAHASSGVYKLVLVARYEAVAGTATPYAGYCEGPIVQMRPHS